MIVTQDGIVDNPDAFNNVVDPNGEHYIKIYFSQKLIDGQNGNQRYAYVDATEEMIYVRQSSVGAIGDYVDGPIVYIIDTNHLKRLTQQLTQTDETNYVAHLGRDKIKISICTHSRWKYKIRS